MTAHRSADPPPVIPWMNQVFERVLFFCVRLDGFRLSNMLLALSEKQYTNVECKLTLVQV